MSPSPKHSLLAGQFVHDLLGVVDEVLAKDLAKCFDRIESDALEMAAREVESHWNDRHYMTNQYEQAQRSAAMIRALKSESK